MCGLAGFYSFNSLPEGYREKLDRALINIGHRGPDFHGTYSDAHIALAHARLSIIDVSENGNQPMTDAGGNFVLVYNGACYNHRELRKILLEKGVTFKSESDTETVLYWLITYGADGLSDINGFFSLAMYDKKNKKLLLARDRFGIKPLHYQISGSGISFSSEIKGILPFGEKYSLNKNSLSAYVHLNYIPSPYSVFNEVTKLLPGTYLSANISGKVELHRYFNTEYVAKKRQNEAGTNLVELLESSVKKRLLSDVSLGCFLSGGLDSSIITGLASRHVSKLNTYTIVYKGDKQFDESKDAALVARFFNTNHHEIEISEENLLEGVSFMLDKIDEPFADSSAIALFNLCRQVRPFIKVALSGDGGDELFAGYYKHQALYYSFRFPQLSAGVSRLNPLLGKMPRSRKSGMYNALRKLERYGASAAKSPNIRYWNWAGYGSPAGNLILNDKFSPENFMSAIGNGKVQNFDDCLKMDLSMVLEGDMLVKSDRMSMMNGIEVRVPFLDHHLVEAVSRIPANQKIAFNKKKYILKERFAHMLPAEILNKKKHGFEVPIKKWLKNDLSYLKKELLSQNFIKEQGIFNPEAVQKVQTMSLAKNSSNSEYTVWNLIVFNSWWKKNRGYI